MPIPLYAAALLAALALSGCHRLSKPDEDFSSRMLALFGKDKAPAIEMPEVAELAKQAQAQRDKLLNHLPKNQWVYIENPPQGTADVQNKNDQDFILSLRLNCKISSQHPAFSLSAADGSIVLKAYDSSSGAVQFLLDNKNYGNAACIKPRFFIQQEESNLFHRILFIHSKWVHLKSSKFAIFAVFLRHLFFD